MFEPIFDHEKLDVYRLSIGYVAAAYEIAKSLTGANRHIRDQWLPSRSTSRSCMPSPNKAVNRSGEIGVDLHWTINRRRPVTAVVRGGNPTLPVSTSPGKMPS